MRYGSTQTYTNIIRNCVIKGNYAAGGGGIFICDYCVVDISDCIVSDNYGTCGGGICIGSLSEVNIERCLINDNIGSYGGGGINNIGATKVSNCVISNNTCPGNREGGAVRHFFDHLEFYNTIFFGNSGPNIVYADSVVATLHFNNCDFFDNTGPLFAGNIPQGLGIINGTNIRGDSCDMFHNIYQNPMFVSTSGDTAYQLRGDSPCIDAGFVPAGPDSDGTAPDIGLYYYHQSPQPPLNLALAPVNPPLTVPASGGSVEFDVSLSNAGISAVVNVKSFALLPQGSYYGPVLSRQRINLPAGANLSRRVGQNVPGGAPEGDYAYIVYAGSSSGGALFANYFEFTKLPGNDALEYDNSWAVYGWDDNPDISIPNSQFLILNSYPNPFNASTDISFKLQAASNVKLTIYDIAGREAAVLAEGFYPAGIHRAEFDGMGLASGVYFARLRTDNLQRTLKILLVK